MPSGLLDLVPFPLESESDCSLPKKSEASPCRVFHEFPHIPAKVLGDSLRARGCPPSCALLDHDPTLGLCRRWLDPLRCGCGAGIGEADLLSKGEGKGEAIRFGGFRSSSKAVSSPSLRPEIRRFARGRRLAEELAAAGVELDWTLLTFIAGRAAVVERDRDAWKSRYLRRLSTEAPWAGPRHCSGVVRTVDVRWHR